LTALCKPTCVRGRAAGSGSAGRRTGERLAVARLDIDGFKTLNDAYSRNEGDQLLRAVATSLALTTRMGDLAARLEKRRVRAAAVQLLPRPRAEDRAARGRRGRGARTRVSERAGHGQRRMGVLHRPGSRSRRDDAVGRRRAPAGATNRRNAVVVETAEAARAVSVVSEPPHR